MTSFLQYIVSSLIGLLVMVLVINAVMSWLIAFDVINLRNRLVYSISRTLDAISNPVLAPARRIIPSMGGLDISPVITIIVLQAAGQYLVPWLFSPLRAIIG
jgi:YggT family protein